MPGSTNYVPNMKWKNILPRNSVISITSFLLLPFVWFSLCSWQVLSITTGLLPSRIVSCMNELKNKTD